MKEEITERQLIKSKIYAKVEEVLNNIENAITTQLELKSKEKLIELFAILDQGKLPSNTPNQAVFRLSRLQLTIRLELLNELASPKEDQQLRAFEQIALLQDKVNGEKLDNSTLLNQWLSHGEVAEDEMALLARIKPIFLE